MTVQQRRFGTTGLAVSELGVGCSRLGGAGGDRKEELAMLGAALDAGVTFFDTSDLYALGGSERRLGEAFRSRRDEVVVATKGGYLTPRTRTIVAKAKPLLAPLVRAVRARRTTGTGGGSGAPAVAGQDFSPVHLRAAVEASLRRLGWDTIDLYQLHSPPRSVLEAADYVEVLETLRAEGKLRAWGLALDGPDDVDGLALPAGAGSLQLPFGVAHQEGAAVAREAHAAGLGVIARSCFAAGLLREEVGPAELQAVAADWRRLLDAREALQRLGRPVLEGALLFVLAQAEVSVAIVGMRTRDHLRSNLALLQGNRLTTAELSALTDKAAP